MCCETFSQSLEVNKSIRKIGEPGEKKLRLRAELETPGLEKREARSFGEIV